MKYRKLLIQIYKDFNNRNIDAISASMIHEVSWPNAWEGGYIKGIDQLRNYWTRQWMELEPTVHPIAFKDIGENRVEVEVKQIVKDKSGKLLFDGMVTHTYTFENGLIKSMETGQPG